MKGYFEPNHVKTVVFIDHFNRFDTSIETHGRDKNRDERTDSKCSTQTQRNRVCFCVSAHLLCVLSKGIQYNYKYHHQNGINSVKYNEVVAIREQASH